MVCFTIRLLMKMNNQKWTNIYYMYRKGVTYTTFMILLKPQLFIHAKTKALRSGVGDNKWKFCAIKLFYSPSPVRYEVNKVIFIVLLNLLDYVGTFINFVLHALWLLLWLLLWLWTTIAAVAAAATVTTNITWK